MQLQVPILRCNFRHKSLKLLQKELKKNILNEKLYAKIGIIIESQGRHSAVYYFNNNIVIYT